MDTECTNSAGPSRGGSANSSSNLSKKFNLGCGQSKNLKKRPLNSKTDSSYEEELYVKGCTAVWSKGMDWYFYFYLFKTSSFKSKIDWIIFGDVINYHWQTYFLPN